MAVFRGFKQISGGRDAGSSKADNPQGAIKGDYTGTPVQCETGDIWLVSLWKAPASSGDACRRQDIMKLKSGSRS